MATILLLRINPSAGAGKSTIASKVANTLGLLWCHNNGKLTK